MSHKPFTLDDYYEQILRPYTERFLVERDQTAEEFIRESDAKLAMSRHILRNARAAILRNKS